LNGVRGPHTAIISRLDDDHGSLLNAYKSMDKPSYPTRQQIVKLKRAAKLPPSVSQQFDRGQISIELPPQGLALIVVRPSSALPSATIRRDRKDK
jgi:xylan 1,4-beta-xylosidase